MKKLSLHYFVFLFATFTANIFSQNLPKIVPLSPNAASIEKYGEIPVGYFTGVPNIGIPIYTATSGELSLPLSLSYHGGGNRVETIASWVGLGWSLNTIPSISRNVRGIADEGAGGYFSTYGGKTVEQLWNLGYTNSVFNSYRMDLFNGLADSEPDIFSYSLPGESGKFFYNQNTQSFVTFPRSNIKIIRNSNNFTLITQDGVEYVMNIVETNTPTGQSASNTTWYASKMTAANKKDDIRFVYRTESQIVKTINEITKYHYLGGALNGFPSDNGSILSINTTNAKVVDSIIFSNGYLKFNSSVGFREDLQNGRNLSNVSVYNKQNILITKHQFTYRYKSGTGNSGSGTPCYQAETFVTKWMLLDKIEQVSNNSTEKLTHSFAYNETYFPACRRSAGQDYWGYYNGHDENASLTPPYMIPGTNPPAQISGANRGVEPIKSKYGILTKITYPTGGFTEFDYENNDVYAADLPPQYVDEFKIMAGDEYFAPGANLNQTYTNTKQFSINNPQDQLLNGNNANGGAYIDFNIGEPGCNLSGGANNCARFTVKGISPVTNTFDVSIYGTTLYLANGTYEMKVSFNQSPPNYRDFFFSAKWKKVDPNQTGNVFAGGLRIKEIKSFLNTAAAPITKQYKYTTQYNSTVSSGDIFNVVNFSHELPVFYQAGIASNGVGTSLLLRVKSTSNMQQVTHSGSPVGYKKIFEQSNDPNLTGYTEYSYSNSRDEQGVPQFPFPPAISMELERGQLTEKKIYKKGLTSFDKVQESTYSYTDAPFNLTSLYPKVSFAIKWGNTLLSDDPSSGSNAAQNMTLYNTTSGWNSLFDETSIDYSENNSIATITNHYHQNPLHLVETKTISQDSRGMNLISEVKYPQDVSPSTILTGLIAQNRLGEVIETKSYRDLNNDGVANSNELLSTQKNDYKIWYSNIILPEFVKTSKGDNNTLENRLVFHLYYDNGKVKEVSKMDGTHIVYIWGYYTEHPIAKIENATFITGQTNTINSSQQALIDNAVSAANSDISITTENTLRTKLQLLRTGFPNSIVDTYTYDPLVGVTSITDPKGYTIFYEYDGFNRLKRVKDALGKILSENDYHYKGQ